MAKPERQQHLPADDGSKSLDENAGLAARLIELRNEVEKNRVDSIKMFGEIRTAQGRMSDRLEAAILKVDRAMLSWDEKTRKLDMELREGAEQVRACGELERKARDRMKVLDELRETQADPHELLKPYRRQLAQLDADVNTLKSSIDRKFEALPKQKPPAAEQRADEGEIGRLRVEVKRLAKLVEER